MRSMTVQERRSKLLEQFQMMIQDEQKMDQLEALLSEMLDSDESSMNESQKKEVLEIRDQVASGEMETTPWNEVRAKLDLKYGI
jgi:hypothetical protein